MQQVESLPVQRVEITLPDIPAQTFVTLGKYGLLVGAGCIIGTVIVALIVETVAFVAAYGVYLVAAGVGVASACGDTTEQAVSKNAAASILVRISAVFFIWTCPFHILR